MKQTFELQQEFEGLISELSRLKSINEITSENSNNAKKTIDEIESFVMAVSIFKTSVEKDYLEKKNNFEKFENALKTSIKSLEINIDKQAKRFEELGNNYSDESVKSLENINKSFGEKIDQFTQLTAKTLVERENNLSVSIQSILDKLSEIQDVEKGNNQLLQEQFQLMNVTLEKNKKQAKNITILLVVLLVLVSLILVLRFK
jgi:hypothetical protein